MDLYSFPPPAVPSVGIAGSALRFPVHRIYCVGRNYAAHAREMGADPDREIPFYFLKSADTVVANGGKLPYPPRSTNLHHEVELVVAIGLGGSDIPMAAALQHVFGYAVGNDATRRDLQLAARDKGRPWDTGKTFEHAAPVSAIVPVGVCGHPGSGRIWLSVNGTIRQDSDISNLLWSVPEIIADLSTYYVLQPGDLIFTGTPEGVGPLLPGDRVEAGITGVAELMHTVSDAVQNGAVTA